MKIVIDKDAEIKKLEDMLETLTDDKDRQSVRFAINLIEGFEKAIETYDITAPSFQTESLISRYQNCGAKMKGGAEK